MLCLFSSGLRLADSIQQEVEAAGISIPLFQSLSGRMADYLVTSRSDNTNVKYFIYFKKWENFIKIQGGCAIPASPIHVALYLTDLMDKHYSYSVISASFYSIKWAHSMLIRYLSITDQSISSFAYLFRPCFRSKAVSHLISKDKPLSYSRARECLISRLKEVAGDLNVGLHSLRAGGASAAANAGVNDRCWKRHGRWKSETSKDGYAADSLERRLEVSKKLGL